MVGEVPEVQRMSKGVGLDNMKELQLQTSKVSTKHAPPFFESMVMSMDKVVVDEGCRSTSGGMPGTSSCTSGQD
eukprot:6433353-Amphidinium_carterae.1